MLINLGGSEGTLSAGVREKIRKEIVKLGSSAKSVEMVRHPQNGMWTLFDNILAISWVCTAGDVSGRQNVQADIAIIEAALLPLLRKFYVFEEANINWHVHDGIISGGELARANWLTMFGSALSRFK